MTEKELIIWNLATIFGEREKFLEHLKEVKAFDGAYVGINIKTRELVILYLN